MPRIVRQSKVRHVYGESAKPKHQFTNAKLSPLTGDQQHIKANDAFIAAPLSNRRGSVAVLNRNSPCKLSDQLSIIDGHKGKTIDFDFSNFDSHLLATGGDDCVVKYWRIPEDGLTETLNECLMNLSGHEKKITVLIHHPSVSGVCVTGSADCSAKIWDVDSNKEHYSHELSSPVQDVSWSFNGSLVSICSKDKLLTLVDPRAKSSVASFEAHSGSKPFKSLFLGDTFNFVTTGFSKSSARSFKIWDTRKIEDSLTDCKLDQSSGTLVPFFDESLNLLFIAGKGDGNIRYFELTDSEPFQFKISEFRSSKATKGISIMPKRCVKVMKHEVDRFYRLTSDTIEPVSFFCPRKAEHFLTDLYPEARCNSPAASAEDFFNSSNRDKQFKPVLRSLDPSKSVSNGGEIRRVKSRREVEIELEEAKVEIKQLKEKLATLGFTD